MIKIRVPATSANIGPGFDSVGIALNIFNSIEVSKKESGQNFFWNSGNSSLPDSENLILNTVLEILKRYGKSKLGFSIHLVECNIPISRGLGSSAASIILGIYAANYLLNNVLSIEEIIKIATEIEGHPDNVVPAILGGMVISIEKENKILFSPVNFPKDIDFNVMIPDFKLSTEMARKALPESYSREDCVNNISRIAMLINSLVTRDYEKIRPSLEDFIHQPYRLKLIKDGDLIFKESLNLNSLGEFISGAGPTIISLSYTNDKNFEHDMKNFLDTLKTNWNIKRVGVNSTGTMTEVI